MNFQLAFKIDNKYVVFNTNDKLICLLNKEYDSKYYIAFTPIRLEKISTYENIYYIFGEIYKSSREDNEIDNIIIDTEYYEKLSKGYISKISLNNIKIKVNSETVVCKYTKEIWRKILIDEF